MNERTIERICESNDYNITKIIIWNYDDANDKRSFVTQNENLTDYFENYHYGYVSITILHTQ